MLGTGTVLVYCGSGVGMNVCWAPTCMKGRRKSNEVASVNKKEDYFIFGK